MNRFLLFVLVLSSVAIVGCRPFAESYEACFSAADCVSEDQSCVRINNGTGSDEICTLTCASDGDCPIDGLGSRGTCSTAGGTSSPICLQRCLSDGDCTGTRICASGGVCLPRGGSSGGTVQNFRSCVFSSDCRDTTNECVAFSVGSARQDICTRTGCFNDDDCPIDARGGRGACLDVGGARACWERCNFRADCENTVEWDCTTSIGGIMAPPPGVCVPR